MLGLASLPIDQHLLAYWGFDEANADDIGIDRSTYANVLTFSAAATPVPGKVGNARTFDGATIYAVASNPTFAAQASHLTILTWATLNSIKTGGSMTRTIIACDGPSNLTSRQNTVFALAVDVDGAVTFRQDYGLGLPILLKTAPGTFKMGHFYFLALIRTYDTDGNTVITLSINGKQTPWAAATVNGVVQGDPNAAVPPPYGGEDSTLRVGVSQKHGDDFWHGLIDETSLHNIERAYSPYITGAYLKTALLTNITQLTDAHTVKGLGVANLNDGGRWWVYERDQNCYAIRESALGTFEQETQLTTGGTQANGAPLPGSTTQPRVAYDKATDTLVVAFIAAGRVYKFTGTVVDTPATLNMPYTQDTTTIIKARDIADRITFGTGPALSTPETGIETPLTSGAVLRFYQEPTFGLRISGTNPTGYRVYRVIGGHEAAIGDAKTPGPYQGQRYYRFDIADRIFGCGYRVRAFMADGVSLANDVSDIGWDRFGAPTLVGDTWFLNDTGDAETDQVWFGNGPACIVAGEGLSVSSVIPLKNATGETANLNLSGDGFINETKVGVSSVVPLKTTLGEIVALCPSGAGLSYSFIAYGRTVIP